MDTKSGMIKIEYWKGAIILTCDADTNHLIRNAEFFTPHYSKDFTWFCILNNYAVKYFKLYGAWYQKNVEGWETIYPYIKNYIDYAKQKDFVYERIELNEITLFNWQVTAVNYMLNKKNFCFYLGQGTGKTLTTIAYFKTVAENEASGTHIVITPKNVISQYTKEAIKYLDGWTITNKAKSFVVANENEHVLLITNYEQIVNINVKSIDNLILDESHNIKSFTSVVNTQAVKLGKRSNCVYEFTGTPQDKNMHEILAQIKVFAPYLIPAKTYVLDRYFIKDPFGNPQRVKTKFAKELEEIITRLTYGEYTEDILDLPPMFNYIIECKFKNKTYYKELTEEFVTVINGIEIIADRDVILRMKQRQLCSGFITTEDGEIIETENPKEESFKMLISDLNHGIIFTNFDHEIVIISRILEALGRTYDIVNGKVHKSASIIDKFKANKFNFLVIHVVSGNAGLDLSNTNNVIFYSLPESMPIFNQARYRIRRIGQIKECNYYYFIVKGTVEKNRIMPSLKVKKEKHVKQYELYRRRI